MLVLDPHPNLIRPCDRHEVRYTRIGIAALLFAERLVSDRGMF